MGEFLDAAFGFPSASFTAAVAAVAVFWLLVLCGAVERRRFDADADAEGLRLGPLPVSVAASVFVATGWVLSVGGSVLLDLSDVSRPVTALLSLALLVLAPATAWGATRRLADRLAKWFPDEPGRPGGTSPSRQGPSVRDRSAALGHHRAPARPGRRG